VIADAHEGLKHAVAKVLGATSQRCRVHWMRNALAHVPKGQHSMVAAALRQAFLQPDRAAAGQTWRQVADQLRVRWPKLANLMDESEHDVLAYLIFPSQHRAKLHSTNPLERLNKEVKRRADVVGIFPGEAAIIRLIGAVLLEQNDEWQTGCRYMQLEGMAELMTPTPTPDAEPAQIQRWSPDFGQADKLGSFCMKDGPDDGEAGTILGRVQGEGDAGGAAWRADDSAAGGQARHPPDHGQRVEAAGHGGYGVGVCRQVGSPGDGEDH
jgi:hypothetical protein